MDREMILQGEIMEAINDIYDNARDLDELAEIYKWTDAFVDGHYEYYKELFEKKKATVSHTVA